MKNIFKHRIFSPNTKFVNRDIALLLFRVAISLAMINTHGIKKLLNYSDTVANIPDPFGMGGEISAFMAILANIVGPIMVIFGFATRLAIIPILSVTIIGLLVVHSADPWVVKDVPLMYSLAYLLVFFLGAGKYSIDHKLFNQS